MAREGIRALSRSKTSVAERPKLRKTPPRSKSVNDRKRSSKRLSTYQQKRYSRRTSIFANPEGASKWEVSRPRMSGGDNDSLWGSDNEDNEDSGRPKTAGKDSVPRPAEDGLPYGFVPDPARFPMRSSSRLRVPSEELIGVALGSPTHVPLMTTMTTMTTFDTSSKGADDKSPLPVLPQHRITLRKSEENETEQPSQQNQQQQQSPNKASPTKAESTNGTQQRGTWKKLLGKGIFSKRSSGGSAKKSMDTIEEDRAVAHASENLLSIDIPKSDMERYSIMFGSVLNPAPPSPKEEEAQPRRTIFERRISGNDKERDNNYIMRSDETPSSSPPHHLRLSPKTPRHLNPEHYSEVLPLSLFPRTPRTPRTPQTPPDEEKLEELRKTLVEALSGVNPEIEPKTPTELHKEVYSRKSRRPESDIVPSLMMFLQNQEFEIDDVEHKDMSKVLLPHEVAIFRGPLSPFSAVSETSSVDIALESGIAVSDFPDPPNMVRLGAEQVWNWEMLTTPLRARTPVSAKIESPAEPVAVEDTAAKDEAERLIASAANMSISRQISMSQRQLNLPIVPDSDRLYFRPTRIDTMSSDIPFDFSLNEFKAEQPPISAVQAIGEARTDYN